MTQKLIGRSTKKPGTIFATPATVGELFTAIQNEVLLSEDDVVVEVINVLFRTGRVKYASC